jgi:hypothetical protein
MVGLVIGIVGAFGLAAMVAVVWVSGIDHMKDNHPDYKGEDFLNEDK